MNRSPNKTVLIAGASVAGPALAYWLHKYGFDVTIVEKAPQIRSGGYPIDIRGTAIEVVKRMGLLDRLRTAHINTRKITFVNDQGKTVGAIKPEDITGGQVGVDIEVPRGVLTALLYDLTQNEIEYCFNDVITKLDHHATGIDVTFHSGRQRTFDLVVAADGMHSTTRELVFGPEEPFRRYLGYCFAGFSLPNTMGFAHEGVNLNIPGKMAALYAAGDSDTLYGLFMLAMDEPPPTAVFLDVDKQRKLLADGFAGCGWHIPEMMAAASTSDDLYLDMVGQIRMPQWVSGRFAVVGDAASAPSFLSGQGSSIALTGAFMLAYEIAKATDPAAPFGAYNSSVRPYIEANQDTALHGATSMTPKTATQLWIRNLMLRAAPLLSKMGFLGGKMSQAHTLLTLPDPL